MGNLAGAAELLTRTLGTCSTVHVCKHSPLMISLRGNWAAGRTHLLEERCSNGDEELRGVGGLQNGPPRIHHQPGLLHCCSDVTELLLNIIHPSYIPQHLQLTCSLESEGLEQQPEPGINDSLTSTGPVALGDRLSSSSVQAAGVTQCLL